MITNDTITDDDGKHIATKKLATPEHVGRVITAEVSADGRSEWIWLRLADGTLMLGLFPCGDLYMEVSEEAAI